MSSQASETLEDAERLTSIRVSSGENRAPLNVPASTSRGSRPSFAATQSPAGAPLASAVASHASFCADGE